MKRQKYNNIANQNSIDNDKAITLIALIVTIIVLLILSRNKYISINRK